MNENLEAIIEWLQAWISGTKDLVSHVDKLIEIAEASENIKDFKVKALEYAENITWFQDDIKSIIETCISDAL